MGGGTPSDQTLSFKRLFRHFCQKKRYSPRLLSLDEVQHPSAGVASGCRRSWLRRRPDARRRRRRRAGSVVDRCRFAANHERAGKNQHLFNDLRPCRWTHSGPAHCGRTEPSGGLNVPFSAGSARGPARDGGSVRQADHIVGALFAEPNELSPLSLLENPIKAAFEPIG